MQYKQYLENILIYRISYYIQLKRKNVHNKLKEHEIRTLSYLRYNSEYDSKLLGYNTELELYNHLVDVFNKNIEGYSGDITIKHLICDHAIPIMAAIKTPIKVGDIGYYNNIWFILCKKVKFNYIGYIVNTRTSSYKIGQAVSVHISDISKYIDYLEFPKYISFRRIKFY